MIMLMDVEQNKQVVLERPDFPDRPEFRPPVAPPKGQRFPLQVFEVAVIALVVIAVNGVVYLQARQVTSSNLRLQAQVTSLQAAVAHRSNVNTAAPTRYKDPAGSLGLMQGAITLTLPTGWQRQPAGDCGAGANIDSKVLCYDIAGVTDAKKLFKVTLSVYAYSSSDGPAKAWVSNQYDRGLASYLTPTLSNATESIVNGNSAYSYEVVATDHPQPDYVNATYVVVHGKYAVVAVATVEDGGVYGGVRPYDYRQTYQPLLTSMMQTVRFTD